MNDFLKSKFKIYIPLILFLWLTMAGSSLGGEKQRVLLLNSYHRGYLWTDEITRGVEEGLEHSNVDLHIEYLDTKRQFDLVYRSILNRLLSWKHNQHGYDLVITSDNNAFDFMLEQGRGFLGDIPHVFCGVNYLKVNVLQRAVNTTGVNEKADIRKNISLIRSLHPNCKKIIVITDNTTTGKFIQGKVKETQDILCEEILIQLVYDVTFSELQQELAGLGKDIVVLYTFFFRDKAGQFREFDASAKFVVDNSPVPVYGAWSFAFGSGIVGGYLVDAYQQGEAAARHAIRVLKGERAGDVPVLWETPVTLRFDHRALKKYGIKENRLPESAELHYLPTSFYHKYKTWIWYFATIVSLLSLALMGTLYGLIRAKQSEKKVILGKENLQTTLDSIGDAVIATDGTGRITRINPVAESLTGWTAREALDTPINEVVHIVDSGTREPVDNSLAEVIDNGHKVKRLHHTTLVSKQNVEYQISESAAPIKDRSGTLMGAVLVFRDVTEIERSQKEKNNLKEQLLHAQKMEAIGTLAGGIAHDFNNILSGIFGYTQMALTRLDDRDKAAECINGVINGAQRAADLTRQILTFSRKGDYEKLPFRIYLEINEALKLIRSTIPTTIKVEKQLDSRAMVLADPVKIHQVIMNLCTNAYHAMMDSGGTLSVALEDLELSEPKIVAGQKIPPGKYVRLEVKDTGSGMDEATLERAFDPYYTTKKSGHGTGLGLSLVNAIVQEHNGFLEVFTRPLGGCRFLIYFPAVGDERKKQKAAPETSSRLSGTETIMVVDDEAPIRNICKESLGQYGYRVRVYEDGEKAMAAFKADMDGFDLILSDITMPNLTGDQLCKEILNLRPDIPIILFTGFNHKISESEAMDVGAKRLIEKPFDNNALISIMREFLDKS